MLGIRSQAPTYVDDVLCSVTAFEDVLRSKPTVVMGDFNSEPNLGGPAALSNTHARLLGAFSDLDMVSAYHVLPRCRAQAGAAPHLPPQASGIGTVAHRLLLRAEGVDTRDQMCRGARWPELVAPLTQVRYGPARRSP